jgi:RsiW-degrading membrane proteinase PrsW (M82 family)
MKKFIKPFFFGIIAALGALILELVFYIILPSQETQQDYYSKITIFLFLVVAVEEALKVLMVYKNAQEFKDENDIFISSFFVGAGFALAELFLKDLGSKELFSIGNMNIVLMHILTAGLVGYFLSKEQAIGRRFLVKIWLLAFLVHLAYNLLVIYFF